MYVDTATWFNRLKSRSDDIARISDHVILF